MRTTLTIDDDVLAAARSLSKLEGRTVGKVISSLARIGLVPHSRETIEDGFPVFEVSKDAPPITPEMVRRAEEE